MRRGLPAFTLLFALVAMTFSPGVGQAKHQGYTASGTYVRPGICATDWVHIPRGARVTVPGLGTCVALDTGVWGWAIDWWFRTAAQCYAVTGEYQGAYYYA